MQIPHHYPRFSSASAFCTTSFFSGLPPLIPDNARCFNISVVVAVAMFNPLYLLGPPALILVSIPLATFAIFTTSLAFSTLFVRVAIIYFELGIALLRSWLTVEEPKPPLKAQHLRQTPSPDKRSPHSTHRRRKSSALSSAASSQEALQINGARVKSRSFATLYTHGAEIRDYEGVGGWRLAGDGEEEALWMGMNSRLQLPATVAERPRHHQRSLTGGSQRRSWSPEAMRISPLQSRQRTPSVTDMAVNQDEYFNVQPHKRIEPPAKKVRKDDRRKSSGSSSTTSSNSTISARGSRLSMQQAS